MAGKGKHNDIDLEKVEVLAGAGISEKNIAKIMDINYKTWQLWKTKNPDINRTLKKAKAIPMDKVVNSLHRSANGYSYTEYKTVFDPKLKKGDKDRVKLVEKTVKWCKPSDTAGIYLTKVVLNWHDGTFAAKPFTKEDLLETLKAMNGSTVIEPDTVRH